MTQITENLVIETRYSIVDVEAEEEWVKIWNVLSTGKPIIISVYKEPRSASIHKNKLGELEVSVNFGWDEDYELASTLKDLGAEIDPENKDVVENLDFILTDAGVGYEGFSHSEKIPFPPTPQKLHEELNKIEDNGRKLDLEIWNGIKEMYGIKIQE